MLLASSILAFSLLDAPASEQVRVNAARTAFESDDFATAVQGFEGLARDYPASPRYHYYAGLAREHAGQDSHAYFHMRVFLASEAGSADERKLAAQRAAAITRRTTRVRLQLPVNTEGSALRVTYRGPKSQAIRPIVVVPLSALPRVDTRPELALEPGEWELAVDPAVLGDEQIEPTTVTITASEPTAAVRLKTSKAPQLPVTLDLDRKGHLRRKITVELRREGSTAPPIVLTTGDTKLHTTLPLGAWSYKASGRGFKTSEGSFSVARPVHETLTLRSDIDDAERLRRRRLGLGLLGTGVVTAAIGTAVMVIAKAEQDRILKPDISTSSNRDADHFVYANTGLGLLGGTTGLWIAATSSSIRRSRGWIPEMTLGALATIAGTAWFGVAQRSIPDTVVMPDPIPTFKSHPGLLASAFVVGVGIGLLGGAITGLLSTRNTEKSSRRASFHISPSPKYPALTFSLAF